MDQRTKLSLIMSGVYVMALLGVGTGLYVSEKLDDKAELNRKIDRLEENKKDLERSLREKDDNNDTLQISNRALRDDIIRLNKQVYDLKQDLAKAKEAGE